MQAWPARACEDNNGAAENTISVEAHKRDNRLWVRICDNGKGLPVEAQASRPGFGAGMARIEGLSRQIGAKPEWSSDGGAPPLSFVGAADVSNRFGSDASSMIDFLCGFAGV